MLKDQYLEDEGKRRRIMSCGSVTSTGGEQRGKQVRNESAILPSPLFHSPPQPRSDSSQLSDKTRSIGDKVVKRPRKSPQISGVSKTVQTLSIGGRRGGGGEGGRGGRKARRERGVTSGCLSAGNKVRKRKEEEVRGEGGEVRVGVGVEKEGCTTISHTSRPPHRMGMGLPLGCPMSMSIPLASPYAILHPSSLPLGNALGNREASRNVSPHNSTHTLHHPISSPSHVDDRSLFHDVKLFPQGLSLEARSDLCWTGVDSSVRHSGILGCPGIAPGHPAMIQGHPGIAPGHHGMTLGHPGMTPGHPGMTPGHPGMTPGEPRMTVRCPEVAMGQPRIAPGHPRMIQIHPGLTPRQPEIALRHPGVALGHLQMALGPSRMAAAQLGATPGLPSAHVSPPHHQSYHSLLHWEVEQHYYHSLALLEQQRRHTEFLAEQLRQLEEDKPPSKATSELAGRATGDQLTADQLKPFEKTGLPSKIIVDQMKMFERYSNHIVDPDWTPTIPLSVDDMRLKMDFDLRGTFDHPILPSSLDIYGNIARHF